MKKMNLLMGIAFAAMLCANGCLTVKKEGVKEPTIEKNTPQKITQDGDVEVIGGDLEEIEVIEREDTTGRVSAAKEAANKLIADAKIRAKNLTRDAENVYDIKKHEAEANADQIIAKAKKQAEKEKEKAGKVAARIIADAKKQAQADKKKAAAKQKAKPAPAPKPAAPAKVDKAEVKKMAKAEANKIIASQKKRNDKIALKVIANAKKSAADILKNAMVDIEKAKKESEKSVKAADKYAKEVRQKADEIVAKKVAAAEKNAAKTVSAKPKTEEEIKAKLMLDSTLKSIPINDYKTFSKDFTVELKKRFTKKKFLQTNKTLNDKLGKITKLTYLGYLRKGPLTVYMWKANFSKTPKENDMIVRLTLGELDKKLQVFAFDIAIL